MATDAHFRPALFSFLGALARHNNRDWFEANKARYQAELRDPALAFVTAFGPRLHRISPHFVADPRPIGGSLFRIHRDTRFAADKTPYKTNTGLQFRHEEGKDAHAPCFYLHLEPKRCFVGAGIWHPDSATAGRLRAAIAADPGGWKRAIGGRGFRQRFTLSGDSLKRPPRGHDPDHPLIEDLKRKDFIAITELSQDQVTSPAFLAEFTKLCRSGAPLVRFLAEALDLDF